MKVVSIDTTRFLIFWPQKLGTFLNVDVESKTCVEAESYTLVIKFVLYESVKRTLKHLTSITQSDLSVVC